MKNYYFKLVAILLIITAFSACKTTKKLAYSPIGAWEYTVTGIPDGDQSGTLMLTKMGDNYTGKLVTMAGSVDMKNVVLADNVLTSNFTIQDMNINLKGLFEGEKFSGTVEASGYEFPITATRKM